MDNGIQDLKSPTSHRGIQTSLRVFGIAFDALNQIISLIFAQVSKELATIGAFYSIKPWYAQVFITLIISRFTFFVFYRKFRRAVEDIKANMSSEETADVFGRALGFKHTGQIPPYSQEELSKGHSANSKIINQVVYKFGLVFIGFKALMTSTFLQFILGVLMGYFMNQ